MSMKPPVTLLPGDTLLYSKSDFFGWVTAIKTFSPAVHVEKFEGFGMSLASRNGIGVNRYPLRLAQLAAVLRPIEPLDMDAVTKWFEVPFNKVTGEGVRDRPYGWFDLARFFNIKLKTDGWICSEFAAMVDRVGGLKSFATKYYAGTIDPGDFFLPSCYEWQWVRPDVEKELTT